jgi:hypothetical protein
MSSGHNLVDFGKEDSLKGSGGGVRSHHHPGLEWISPLAEVNEMVSQASDAILVGAADRYRLGEMLMPHVLARLLHFSKIRCAGLVSADHTPVGGHVVRNYGECLLEMRRSRLKLVHTGGDLLGLDLVDAYRGAAVEEEAERFESLAAIGTRDALLEYVRRRTGQISELAYVLAPVGELHGAGLGFHAVGLPDPGSLGESARAELLSVLRSAQFVGVRDENGAGFLESEGIAVERMPCALSVLPQVCGRQLRESRDREAISAIRRRFPNGWIAVETSEIPERDFDRLVAALREVSDRENLGLVFFEANAVPGRVRRAGLRRWVESFPEWQAAEFASDHLWETASLLLHSRLYCGSCLGARIICMSGGVARINVPTGSPAVISYAELWEHDEVPIEFSAEEDWAGALSDALTVDLSVLQQHANWLHGRYRESLDRFCRETGIEARLVPGQSPTDHERIAGFRHHLHDEWLQDPVSLRRFRLLNRSSRKNAGREGSGRDSDSPVDRNPAGV